MIEVDVSNWSSYFFVMKLLRFGFHKIAFFFAFGEEGLFLTLKKKSIRSQDIDFGPCSEDNIGTAVGYVKEKQENADKCTMVVDGTEGIHRTQGICG